MTTKKPLRLSPPPRSPIADLLGLGLMLEIIRQEMHSYKRGRVAGVEEGRRVERARVLEAIEGEEE